MTGRERGELLRSLDGKVRRDCRFSSGAVERLEKVTRVTGSGRHHGGNSVFWSDLDEENADGVIGEQVRYFESIGHQFLWMVYGHDRPGDLVDRLAGHGFEIESEETVVVARSADAAEYELPAGIEIRRIDGPEGVKDAVDLGNAVWGSEQGDFLTKWLTDLVEIHPEESVVHVAYDGGEPVGVGWATYGKGRPIAMLFGGTVLPEWRRRGIYRAMVGMRAEVAMKAGTEWCLVEAGGESCPILERIGFQRLTTRTGMKWTG